MSGRSWNLITWHLPSLKLLGTNFSRRFPFSYGNWRETCISSFVNRSWRLLRELSLGEEFPVNYFVIGATCPKKGCNCMACSCQGRQFKREKKNALRYCQHGAVGLHSHLYSCIICIHIYLFISLTAYCITFNFIEFSFYCWFIPFLEELQSQNTNTEMHSDPGIPLICLSAALRTNKHSVGNVIFIVGSSYI